MTDLDKKSFLQRKRGHVGDAATSVQRQAETTLKAHSVTAPDALLQTSANAFDAAKDAAEREVEISDKAAESFVEGLVKSMRAGELDLPTDAPEDMRKKVRALKTELANLSDEELQARVGEDVAAFGGDDVGGITDENNLVLKYLLAIDRLEKVTDEKEIAEIEKAYKHVKGGYSRRVFYKIGPGWWAAQGLNASSGVLDVPAGTGALVALGGPISAGVAVGAAATEILTGNYHPYTKAAIGAGGLALGTLALMSPAAAAPIIAVGVMARTTIMKAGTKSPADMSPVGIVKKVDGKWKVQPRLKAKGWVYLGVAAAVSTAGGTLLLKTMQNSGAAKEIAEVARANADKSLGEIRRTRDEIKAAPQAFRDAAHTAYEQALLLGGKGHGPRTARTVQIYFGDYIINKDGTRGKSNRDAFQADSPNSTAFDGIEKEVKEQLVKLGVKDPSRGLLGYIDDQLKLLTLVDRTTKADELAQFERDGVKFLDVREVERRADKLSSSADAIGKVTPYDELMAGWFAAGKQIWSDPRTLASWSKAMSAIFEDHGADISSLEALDATKQKALLELAQQLTKLTVEEDIRAMVAKIQASGIALVDGDKQAAAPAQAQQVNPALQQMRAQEAALVKQIAAARQKRQNTTKLESDLAALRTKITEETAKTGAPAAPVAIGGKVDVLAAFKVPSLKFTLSPEIVQQLGIKFEGGLQEVVLQDFFKRIQSLINGMSPELKKYAARGLANTWVPGIGYIQLDAKDPNFDNQIRKWLAIAVFILFFSGPLAVGIANSGRRWSKERWHKKDDKLLADGEKNIAKDVLAHIRLREKSITDALFAQGIAIDPSQTGSEINEQALADLIRKAIVREMDPDGDRLSLFASRGEQLRDTADRKTYGFKLDALQKLVADKKYDEVLAVLLPEQVKVEARIKDKLELLRYNIPSAREGIVQAVKNGLLELKDPIRAESIVALRREIAESDAVLDALRVALSQSSEITQDSVLYEEYLRTEMVRRASLGLEYDTFTSGTLGGKSTEALDAELPAIDDAEIQKTLAEFIQSQQLRNEWRSGSGLTIEQAQAEISKFWEGIVKTNSKRLQDACALALKGMPLQGEIKIERAYLVSTGEPTIRFAMKLVDGTEQQLTFNKAVPSVGLETTEKVVLELEQWLAKGGTVTLDLQLAVDNLLQKKEDLMRAAVVAGVTRSGDILMIPHGVLMSPDYQKQIQELVMVASGVAIQKTVVAALELSKNAPTPLQEKVLRDPIANNAPGLFKDNISKYINTEGGVSYRLDLISGVLQQQKGGKILEEDVLFRT